MATFHRTVLAALFCAVSQAAASPPATPAGAVTITPAALEKLRRSGSVQIEPKPVTREQMERQGARKVSTDAKVCISTYGTVVYSEIVKPSDYEAYDLRVRAEIADWMFDPYKPKDRPAPACATVTITYQPPNPQGPDRGPLPTALQATTKEAMAALRADVDMICGAARATGGKYFLEVGPYIAEHMKTDLLADLLSTISTGDTTLEMILKRVRLGMAKAKVKRCATMDVLLKHRPR